MFEFEILQHGPDNESVWFWGYDGREVILGAVSREAIEDDTDIPQTNLTHQQRLSVAAANVEEITSVLRRKIAAGEATRPSPGERPRVVVRSGELRRAGVVLKTSVLNMTHSWI